MANEYLSAAALATIQTMARNAVEGVNTASVSITYTQVTARTINPTAGSSSQTTNAVSITAMRMDFASKQDGEGREDGMVTYAIEARRLTGAGTPITEPRRQDRITEGSVQYEVQDWSTDPARAVFWVKCSKVGT